MTEAPMCPRARLQSISKSKADLLKLLLEEESRRSYEIKPCPRAPKTRVRVPTSWPQQRLWFIDQLEGGSAGYQVPVAVRLKGDLNRDALRRALDDLVKRHEILRTVFVDANGEPAQEIMPSSTFALRVFDLIGYEQSEREAQVRQHKIDEVHAPFDLSVGPLIRARLLRLQASEHVLLIIMHHIIADGWSKGVLIRELACLYRAYSEGRDNPLVPLRIQYADYAHWQRQQVRRQAWDQQLNYWRARLKGAAPQLELPTDRPRPAVQSYRGENLWVAVDAQLTEKLKSFAQRHELTLFMILFAAWSLLLSRLSGQEDLSIGTPIANRQHPEIEGLIGLFVNTLVLRVEVRADLQVRDFLKHVKEVTLAAYDNQDVPFEQIVEAIQPQRSLSCNPIFQVMMVLHNEPRSELHLPGLTVTIEDVVEEPSFLDLFLPLEERNGELVGSVNCVFHGMPVADFAACRSPISRHAGRSFHVMPVAGEGLIRLAE